MGFYGEWDSIDNIDESSIQRSSVPGIYGSME